MKIIILLVSIFSYFDVAADETYSVYLVRHAEKDVTDPDNHDPQLRSCGIDRAERLASIFQSVDLKAVYSTDYARTQSTARPTADSKNLAVKTYDPVDLDVVFDRLITKKQDALVVGHSNTTNVLAGKLAGIELEDIDEEEYDRLYQVVLFDGSAELELLHQVFQCAR